MDSLSVLEALNPRPISVLFSADMLKKSTGTFAPIVVVFFISRLAETLVSVLVECLSSVFLFLTDESIAELELESLCVIESEPLDPLLTYPI